MNTTRKIRYAWMKFTQKWITTLAFWVSVNFLPKRGGAGRFGSLLTSTSAPPLHNKNMKIVRLLCHCSCKVTDKQNRCHSVLFIHNNSLDCILNLFWSYLQFSISYWLSCIPFHHYMYKVVLQWENDTENIFVTITIRVNYVCSPYNTTTFSV